MPIPATVRYNAAESVAETIPRAITESTELSIIRNANVAAWWPGERGMMEGVIAETLVRKWKDSKLLRNLIPKSGGSIGSYGYDSGRKKGFARLGQGGLSRVTYTLLDGKIAAGGSGHAVNDQITFQNGVVIQLTAVSAGAGQFSAFTILNYGAFGSQPSAPLTQVSTTGTGTGMTFAPEFSANNGSLYCTDNIVPATGSFAIAAVFRAPLTASVASSGGIIAGGALTQTEVDSSAANNRWWGLRVGRGAYPGRLVFSQQGDGVLVQAPTATDYRDNAWHVSMGIFVAGGTSQLWVDGVNVGTAVGTTPAGVNVSTGGRHVRVGAAGLPAVGPTTGASLDIGDVMLINADLAAETALRDEIINWLVSKWRT